MDINFKKLCLGDKAIVTDWLQQDYIAQYWYGEGLKNTLQSIDQFVLNKPTIYTLWIAYDQSVPFGFLMVSKVNLTTDHLFVSYCEKNSRAITLDVLIGNTDYLGKGFAQQMIQELISQKYSTVTDVFIDPDIDNPKAIDVYEKVGFKKCGTFHPEHDSASTCQLMHWKK